MLGKRITAIVISAAFITTVITPVAFATVESVETFDEGYTILQTKTLESGQKAARTETVEEHFQTEYGASTKKLKQKTLKINKKKYVFRISRVKSDYTHETDRVSRKAKGSTKAYIEEEQDAVRDADITVRYPENIKGYTRGELKTKTKKKTVPSMSFDDGDKDVVKEEYTREGTYIKGPTIRIKKSLTKKRRYITITYVVPVVTTKTIRKQSGGKKNIGVEMCVCGT